jgi:hypothetical protein
VRCGVGFGVGRGVGFGVRCGPCGSRGHLRQLAKEEERLVCPAKDERVSARVELLVASTPGLHHQANLSTQSLGDEHRGT